MKAAEAVAARIDVAQRYAGGHVRLMLRAKGEHGQKIRGMLPAQVLIGRAQRSEAIRRRAVVVVQ